MAAEAAGSNYLIVRNIQSHLGWKDLKVCKSVSKLWKDVAENTRGKFSVETYHTNRRTSKSAKIRVEGSLRVEPSFTLVFIAPVLYQSFIPCNLFPTRRCVSRCQKHSEPPLKFMQEDFSHPGAEILGVYASEVFHSTLPKAIFSGFSFPNLDGVSVRKLMLPSNNYENLGESITQILETDIVKSVLIFVNDQKSDFDFLSESISLVFDRQAPEHKFSIGGGIVEYMTDDGFEWEMQTGGTDCCTTLIIFSVSKNSQSRVNFESYSSIFYEFEKTQADLEKKMKKISDAITIRQHSLAFKFSCCDRYKLNEIERRMFIKYFPTTPMIGCDAAGEIGFDSIFSSSPPEDELLDLFYSYSTILVISTWDDN